MQEEVLRWLKDVRDAVRAALTCKAWRDCLVGGSYSTQRRLLQPFFHPSLQQAFLKVLGAFTCMTVLDLSACSAVQESWLTCLKDAPIQVRFNSRFPQPCITALI